MKTRIVIGSLVLTTIGLGVMAQENDDMYFNSKDRQKQKVEGIPTVNGNQKIDDDYNSFRKKHFDQNEKDVAETSNPTDSYSARTVNPEYISRSNSEQASEDEQNYYEEGYAAPSYDAYSSNNNTAYNNYNGSNAWNGNYGYYNNPNAYSYNNPYSYYSPYNSIYPSNSFYNSYYGCNPWMSPYVSSGWGISMSYSWGSPYSYSPYGYYGYYSPYSSSGWGYPGSYYYSGTEASRTHYGKRPSRHSAVVLPTRQRPEREVTSTTNGRTSGRTRPAADEYYVKPFKRTSTFDRINLTTGTYSRDQYSTKPSSTDRSRFSESSSQSQPSYSSPSRSRSMSSGSAPTRSSSSSSGSRSRGRD